MRAAGTPLADRCASTVTWLAMSVVILGAGAALAVAPRGGQVEPGDVVNYSEDRVGRPWRVVREHEFGRYVIRNGRQVSIADANEISPYRGPSRNITVEMTGPFWREKVAEIRGRTILASASDRL